MLLKRRPPGLDAAGIQPRPGYEHLERRSLAVLRWLLANRIDFVVVGPVAEAIRGNASAAGPVAIVPAPYVRNYERLTQALVAEHAGLRSDRELSGAAGRSCDPIVLTADKLARGRRWMLSFGEYDLDIERAGTRAPGTRATEGDGPQTAAHSAPRFQELLYESNRFEVADGIAIEVASPEDLVHYDHVRRTGVAPEFRVARVAEGPDTPVQPAQPAPPEASRPAGDPRADGGSAS